MADQRLTSLTAITTPATGDKIYIIDVSDTTDNANGSSRQITYGNFVGGVLGELGINASVTELNYVDGVTSAIQTQMNLKAPLASPTFTGTVTLPIGLTGVIRTDSGVVSVDSDVTDIVSAASTSAAGKAEIAVVSEINTGTDTGRVISPDGLAGSNFGIRVVGLLILDDSTVITTGDGKGDVFFRIPSVMNGMNLVAVAAHVQTAGTGTGTQTTDIQIHNVTDSVDMLSTKLTIDEDEKDSATALAAAVIDTTKDDVATADELRFDVDAIPGTTGGNGLYIELQFQLP